MNIKRIIPCMDIRGGRVVKGVNFEGIQDVEDPVSLARFYNESGADELVFYDITASLDGRTLFMEALKCVAKEVSIPLVAGGGISTISDFERALDAGAKKVSINTGAIKNPSLIDEGAKRYGSECVIFSMDVKRVDGRFHLFTDGGRVDTGRDALEWAVEGVKRGAGELVVNSIDTDGVKGGFDLEMLRAVCERVKVPVIASGGAGSVEHFFKVFEIPGVEAGLAASIFHRKEVVISDLKKALSEGGVPVLRRDKNGFEI